MDIYGNIKGCVWNNVFLMGPTCLFTLQRHKKIEKRQLIRITSNDRYPAHIGINNKDLQNSCKINVLFWLNHTGSLVSYKIIKIGILNVKFFLVSCAHRHCNISGKCIF